MSKITNDGLTRPGCTHVAPLHGRQRVNRNN